MKILINTLLAVVFVCSPFVLRADTAIPKPDISTITVTGKAEVMAPSDMLKISLSIVTSDKTTMEALKKNSIKINKTIEALKETGLTKDNIQTERYTLTPDWSPRPHNPPKDWKPVIAGYTVNNSILVKTKKLDLSGKIIEAAIKAGTNKVNSLVFALDDQNKFKNEAIEKAIKNASLYAETIAKSTNTRILKIRNVNLDNVYIMANNVRNYSNSLVMMEGAADKGAAPAINPGKVKISADVSIIYVIAPLKFTGE